MAKTKDKKDLGDISLQDGRVMIAARIDEALVKRMKKWGIDHGMTYREVIEKAIIEFLNKYND